MKLVDWLRRVVRAEWAPNDEAHEIEERLARAKENEERARLLRAQGDLFRRQRNQWGPK